MFEHFQHVNQHLSLAKVEPPYLSTTSCIRFILIVISPLFQLSLGDDNVITIDFVILQYHNYSSISLTTRAIAFLTVQPLCISDY